MLAWIGSDLSNNNWNTGKNWQGGSPPCSYQSASFQNGATIFLSNNHNIEGLLISGTVMMTSDGHTLYNDNARLTLEGGSVLVLDNVHLVTQTTTISSGQATIRLQGAQLEIECGSYMPATLDFQDRHNADGSVSGSTVMISYDGAKANMFASITNLTTRDAIMLTNASTRGSRIYLQANGDGSYSLIEQVPEWGGQTSILCRHVTLAAGLTASDFTSLNQNGILALVCFLGGSMISTPEGEKPVETICPGHTILAFENSQSVARKVIWSGVATTHVNQDLPADQAGYPVRIRKDAVSDHVPYKDMLITPDHCLYLDGYFIPARLLVNGRTIFYDRSFTSYQCYHIETEKHAIITADGVLTETYLDTGNRRQFSPLSTEQTSGNVTLFGGRKSNWAEDAAAKLAVTPDLVEPVFRRIEARANEFAPPARPSTTTERQLQIKTQDGQMLRQVREINGRVLFMVPAGVNAVRILSNASRPCDVTGPFLDDRRNLGVLIGEAVLYDSGMTHTLNAHLEHEGLEGWHNPPPYEASTGACSGQRWTNGNALLPLGKRQDGAIGLLSLQVLAGGPYIIATPADEDRLINITGTA
ncbi:Adhesin family protein [Granulibacter bethesdensis]|nr:Adhesin family protein [Granulibacter bethesdensis]